MRRITASDVNRRFSSLLRNVAAGETVIVTSHGRAVAKLAPVGPADFDLSDAERARRGEAWDMLEARLRSRPAQNLGRLDRESLYDRDP